MSEDDELPVDMEEWVRREFEEYGDDLEGFMGLEKGDPTILKALLMAQELPEQDLEGEIQAGLCVLNDLLSGLDIDGAMLKGSETDLEVFDQIISCAGRLAALIRRRNGA